MRIKNIIVTLWFNKYDNLKTMSEIINENFKMYFPVCQFMALPANMDPIIPRITGKSGSGHSSFSMSTINAQITTNYDNNFNEDYDKCFEYIEERVKKLYELLQNQGIDIFYSAIFVNLEKDSENPIEMINNNLINERLKNDNLNEIGMRMALVEEDSFYKIIVVNNSKDYTMQREIKSGENIILPLISLRDAKITKEYISISYELNDKYSFDNKENYSNSIDIINRMFLKAKEDIANNIEALIKE